MRFQLLIGALATCLATSAQAFCGFYVARDDGKLFNDASRVIYARDGWKTRITMASDYTGDPSDFAMIVPTPFVLTRDLMRTVKPETLDHLDRFSEPRLVEYFDDDPCPYEGQLIYEEEQEVVIMEEPSPASAKSLGVRIEAQYVVDEYDIVILSASQSDGLETWLQQEGYNIPEGASAALAPYIEGGMKFFVAKVSLERHAASEKQELSPLQIRFSSEMFMLPIQLGMVNARGPQDLILMTVTRNGRVDLANYQVGRVPTDLNIPVFVEEDFDRFYRDMFIRALGPGGTGAMLEYAWNLDQWCDPCSAEPLDVEEMFEIGADWVRNDGDQQHEAFLTRLHIRYDRQSFPQDLMLRETRDTDEFQGRYVMTHPFPGPLRCSAPDYVREVRARTEKEAQTLLSHTGWPRGEIRRRILQSLPAAYR